MILEKIYHQGFSAGFMPDPDHTVSTWADEHRVLSQKASAEPGHWRTERTPYLREIMDEMSPSSPSQRVVFMAGAQVGKSEAGNNWVGFVVHHAPGPMLLVQPTVDTAKRFSKQRLAPMIEESPCLRERILENKSRDAGNAMMAKEFPGGVLIITGANSAAGLRSMPIRYLFLDEIDAYPLDVDGEGDPIQLAEKRTTTFARRKIYMSSTPTVKDISRIEREFNDSDQRRYFVPCPHCDHMQWLKWSNMKWFEDDPATACYMCESCAAMIDERHKTAMLNAGRWISTGTGDGRTVGFHLSSLYSPLGWKSWADIVSEFIKAKSDALLLKTFVNTVLGETWEDEYAAKIGAGDLQQRVEFYDSGVAPARVLTVTAGVDVQDNRLAISLYGWGRDEECWLIDHVEIFGDPAQQKLWGQLDELILKPLPHELAENIKVSVTCIDSGGHFTNEVYAYARERKKHNVFAVKGQSQKGKSPIGKASKVDINWRGKIIKGGAEVYPVGSDTIKSTIFARLKLNQPGAGYLHFHAEASAEYFAQLTAEKQVTKYVRGFPVREWVKKSGARNEALDCAVYAYAALQWLYMRYNRKTIWEQFERQLNIVDKVSVEPEEKPKPVGRRTPIINRKPSFITGW
ncbi:MAG: phage terminase large subunit family protein [Planctomycetes bacterium]|nr:phage terminase large subunit family protein [Planctomycetota bacterium]